MSWYDDPARQRRAANRILRCAKRMLRAHADRRANYWSDSVQVVWDADNAYAEPGYLAPVVCLADWHAVTQLDGYERRLVSDLPVRVNKALTSIGVACEFSDSWVVCGQCGRLVRQQPDGSSWAPSYHYWDGEIECVDCADPYAVIDELCGQDYYRIPRWIDLSEHGLLELDTYTWDLVCSLARQDIKWVVDQRGTVWVDRRPDESKEHLLYVMALLGACREATLWVEGHASIDACEIVQDRTHLKGNEWAAWLLSALRSRAQGGVWFDALESRVQADRVRGEM